MNLFFKRRNPAEPPENTFEIATPSATEICHLREISMSTEQRGMLDQPLDPRVGRIMEQIYADKTAAERALNSRQIVRFPSPDSGERHVIQDADGFWRIVPGPAPKESAVFDAL
jgi:hypothetical protein